MRQKKIWIKPTEQVPLIGSQCFFSPWGSGVPVDDPLALLSVVPRGEGVACASADAVFSA